MEKNYNFQVYAKPHDFNLPKPKRVNKPSIIVNEGNCFLNNNKYKKYRIINGLTTDSSLPDIRKITITETNNKDSIQKLKNKIDALTDDLKRKNQKIDELNTYIRDIKSSNDISAVFLIKSQEKMIKVLTEQNEYLGEEITKYKEKIYNYKRRINELIYQIDQMNQNNCQKQPTDENFKIEREISVIYIPSKKKENTMLFITENKFNIDNNHIQVINPLKLIRDEEKSVKKYILGLYLQMSNKDIINEYLSDNNNEFNYETFVDLIFKSISQYHWKSSQDHYDLIVLIFELSHHNGAFSKSFLQKNLSSLMGSCPSTETSLPSLTSIQISSLTSNIANFDIYKTGTVPVSALKDLFDNLEIPELLFYSLLTKLKLYSISAHDDEPIFSINYHNISIFVGNEEQEENMKLARSFVDSIFKTVLNS